MLKRLLLRISILLVVLCNIAPPILAFDKLSDNKDLLFRGSRVAELQNSYSYHFNNSSAYLTVFEMLREYFGSTDEDACRIWPSIGQWRFATKYVTGEYLEPVLWLCYTDSGRVTGYGIAEYDRTLGKFVSCSVHSLF